MNTLGQIVTITSFGESHGPGIGAVLDGFPSGYEINMESIHLEMNRRAPGRSYYATERNEKDLVQILSGVFEGKTTGAPITFWIENNNQQSADYDHLKEVFRPSHADFVYQEKYGIRDHRGGGRSSARITAAWVAAGALCKQWLEHKGIQIESWVTSIGPFEMNDPFLRTEWPIKNSLGVPDSQLAQTISDWLLELKNKGNSAGGIVQVKVEGCPVGLGEPVFGKFQSRIAQAIFSLNAVKGLEFGDGFQMAHSLGSEMNDSLEVQNDIVNHLSNHGGGIEAGISNGAPILFKIAFKPPASIKTTQQTINLKGENVSISVTGRHDPCVVPRALPIVESLSALVCIDLYLIRQAQL